MNLSTIFTRAFFKNGVVISEQDYDGHEKLKKIQAHINWVVKTSNIVPALYEGTIRVTLRYFPAGWRDEVDN